MATQQISSTGLKAALGAVLFALGFAILFGNLEGLSGPLAHVFGVSEPATPGISLSLVLTIFHAMQEYAFDPQSFLLGLRQILISFWPLGLVLLGTVLLRDTLVVHFARFQDGIGSTGSGDR